MINDLIRRLNWSIATFDKDPPDSDYQRGYLAALKNMREEARALVPASKHTAQ